jgi:NTP pyrophosphatase (non-canonical NTP hydrolase)
MEKQKVADMQLQVHEWTSQYKPQYWPVPQIIACLAEEVGEVARNINHIHGFKKKKADEALHHLGEELADVTFTLACMAGIHEINMEAGTTTGDREPYSLMTLLVQQQGKIASIIIQNNTSALPGSIASMLATTIALAEIHKLDLYAEFNKVMQVKMYGRDANRFTKV